MTRIDYLMQDRERVIQFIRQIFSDDWDCQYCPFCNEEGILLGCNISADDDTVECAVSEYLDIEDFLLEEMPSEEVIKKWEKEVMLEEKERYGTK